MDYSATMPSAPAAGAVRNSDGAETGQRSVGVDAVGVDMAASPVRAYRFAPPEDVARSVVPASAPVIPRG